jgi:hypothetical protein
MALLFDNLYLLESDQDIKALFMESALAVFSEMTTVHPFMTGLLSCFLLLSGSVIFKERRCWVCC